MLFVRQTNKGLLTYLLNCLLRYDKTPNRPRPTNQGLGRIAEASLPDGSMRFCDDEYS